MHHPQTVGDGSQRAAELLCCGGDGARKYDRTLLLRVGFPRCPENRVGVKRGKWEKKKGKRERRKKKIKRKKKRKGEGGRKWRK